MKKITMLFTAFIFSAALAFAQEPTKGCCKQGETCNKECKEMCEKHGCTDGKCSKECKKACKEAGNKDCQKGKCCSDKKNKA
jgi:hypothetical protein